MIKLNWTLGLCGRTGRIVDGPGNLPERKIFNDIEFVIFFDEHGCVIIEVFDAYSQCCKFQRDLVFRYHVPQFPKFLVQEVFQHPVE